MKRRGLYGDMVEAFGRLIVHGDIAAGTTLSPATRGSEFDASRSVVRETLRTLESKGLVAARQNIGTYVLPASSWHGLDLDVLRWRLDGPDREIASRELQEMRSALEPLAAALAATRITAAQLHEMRGVLRDMTEAVSRADAAAILTADIAFHQGVFDIAGNSLVKVCPSSSRQLSATRTLRLPRADFLRTHWSVTAHYWRLSQLVMEWPPPPRAVTWSN
jgi:DNA-binding FadR family transcriptional regulator